MNESVRVLVSLIVALVAGAAIAASAAALFGGLDSLQGAVVGGITIGVLEAMLSGYVSFIGGELQHTSALLIIVAILFIRPNGLFGSTRTVRV